MFDSEGYKAIVRSTLKGMGVDPYMATMAAMDLERSEHRGDPLFDACEWGTEWLRLNPLPHPVTAK